MASTLKNQVITNSAKKKDTSGILEAVIWRLKTLRFLQRKRINDSFLVKKVLFEKRQFLDNLPFYVRQANTSTRQLCLVKHFEITILNGNYITVLNQKTRL